MPDRATDEQFLQRALDEARKGTGLASPGPYIGAIIVDSGGRVAGTGFYTYDRVKHAEVLALEQAGANARGGTLYINLEPHCHQGRTPPCTDALIEAGIRRVVACMPDPNPKVSGKGFEQLRTAGIAVEVGGFESEARRLNEAFARYIRNGIPLVTLKSAMTLDGKIAPPPGAKSDHKAGIPPGGWITGETARANVHEQRHQSDAILVGIGTILADDPLLTDRSGQSAAASALARDSRFAPATAAKVAACAERAESMGRPGRTSWFSIAAPKRRKRKHSKGAASGLNNFLKPLQMRASICML